jgi:hypothetical protein
MADYEKLCKDYRLSSLAAELVDHVLSLPPEHQRDLLAELKARKNSARRRFFRRSHSDSVQFTAGGRLFAGNMKNISDGGAFVEVLDSDLKRLAKGEQVVLSFSHPSDSKYVKRSGEIARTAFSGVGIRFNSSL